MKQRMTDNEWMYSGRISAHERTTEWEWKTNFFVRDATRGSTEFVHLALALNARGVCVRESLT